MPRKMIGLVCAGVMIGPAVGLLSAVIDRAGSQNMQIEAFSLALTVFDPLVQQSLRNSLLMAVGVSLVSMGLGLILASISRRGGRVGRMIKVLSTFSASMPCIFLSLGILGWLSSLPGGLISSSTWIRVSAWFWVEASWGVGVVLVSAGHAMGRVVPVWEEAATLAGGRSWLIWKVVARPVVLPSVVRAGWWVLVGTLFEPTAPLLFGLRRTLASQLVDSALGSGSDPVARAPSLVILALMLSAVLRALLLTWGGHQAEGLETQISPQPRTTRRTSIRAVLGLLILTVLVLGPIAGLAHSVWNGLSSVRRGSGPTRLLALLQEASPCLIDSAILGASAASISLAAAALCFRRPGSRLARFALWAPTRLPALALAVGASGLVWMLEGAEPSSSRLAPWLDPFAAPGALLVLVVSIVHVPRLAHLLQARIALFHSNQHEAARLLGGRRSVALRWRTIAWPRMGPPLVSAWLWTALLASFETSAALVLTPTSAFRPLGPSLMDWARSPENLFEVTSLALAGWLVLVVGFSILGRNMTAYMGDSMPPIARPTGS